MSNPKSFPLPRVRRTRAVLSSVVALALGSLFATSFAGTATAAPATVDLTVSVTSKSGAPLTGVTIYAEPVANGDLDFARYYVNGDVSSEAVTGKPGTYLLSDIAADEDFTLYFEGPDSTGAFSQFYGGVTSVDRARVLSFSAGAQSLSVSLATNSKVTGKATTVAGTGIPNIHVHAYRFDGTDWVDTSTATTSSTGLYTLADLDPGSYKLEFHDQSTTGYLTKFSGDAATLAAATSFYVGLGETASSSVKLAVGGAVSGTVLWDDGEETSLTDGVTPVAYRLLGTAPTFTSPDFANPYYGLESSSTGAWRIPGLPAGTYVVQLLDDSYREALDTFVLAGGDYGAATWNTARKIAVTAGSTVATGSTTLASELLLDFTAQVAGPGGVPVEGAYVQLWSDDDADRYFEASVGTDETGSVTIEQVHPGRYSIGVTVPDSEGNARFTPNVDIRTLADASDYDYTVTLDALDPLTVDALSIINTELSAVGTTYEAVATASLPHAVLDYQWLRNGFPIFGARSDSYTATGGDVGKSISVRVRANAWGYYPAYANAVVDNPVTEGDAATNSVAPSIVSSTTEPQPGSTLTARAGSWSIPGVNFRYQWLRDSTPIAGQFGSTYSVQPADALSSISVEVTAAKTGYADSAVVESAAVAIGENSAPVVKTAPKLTTKALSGGRVAYSVSKGTWSVSGLSYAYQWNADGLAIPGAVSPSFTYEPGAFYVGRAITVTLTVSRAGYETAERTVFARKGTSVPTIIDSASVSNSRSGAVDGTVFVGDTLTAEAATLGYPGAGAGTATTRYQWQSSANSGATWSNISLATKRTFTVPLSLNGKDIRVSLVSTSSIYASLSHVAEAGTVVLSDALVALPSPTVSVTGSGSVATAHTAVIAGSWPVSPVVLSYQWQKCTSACADSANWTNISGATAASHTPVAALAGSQLRVLVTAKKSGYQSVTVAAALVDPLSALSAVTALKAPQVLGTVSGDAKVGVKLTAKAGTFDVASTTRSYAWQTSPDGDDWTQVATGTSYTPTAAVFVGGATLVRVVETAAKSPLTSGVASGAAIDLVENQVVNTALPKVSNSGGVLSASQGSWSPSTGATFEFEWFIDGVSDGSGSTHTVGAPGQAVTVDVTASVPGYGEKTVRVLAQRGAAPAVVSPSTITGSQFGDTLVAPTPFTYPVSSHPATTYKYQWYVGSSAITGATKSTFKPSTSYIGKSIKVKVTAASPYYGTASATSAVTVLAKRSASASVSVTTPGAVQPGAKLTAVVTLPTTGMTVAYRWQTSTDGISWASLSGKTASTYTVAASDPGSYLRVQVIANKTGYTTVVANSSALTPSYLLPLDTLTDPVITGPGTVGIAHTVTTGTWNTSGLTYSYQWFRNSVAIPGATKATFTPLADSENDTLWVRVTASKSGYESVSVTSAHLRIAEGAAPTASVTPRITGLAREGQTLSATTGTWNVDGLTFTYVWYADGDVIAGQASNTLVLTADHVGAAITVVVIADRAGYETGESLESVATALVETSS